MKNWEKYEESLYFSAPGYSLNLKGGIVEWLFQVLFKRTVLEKIKFLNFFIAQLMSHPIVCEQY